MKKNKKPQNLYCLFEYVYVEKQYNNNNKDRLTNFLHKPDFVSVVDISKKKGIARKKIPPFKTFLFFVCAPNNKPGLSRAHGGPSTPPSQCICCMAAMSRNLKKPNYKKDEIIPVLSKAFQKSIKILAFSPWKVKSKKGRYLTKLKKDY